MNERSLRLAIASDYAASLLRSRAAIDRILACVADVAERDEGCARAIAAHPEALAALSRSASPAPWMLEALGAGPPPAPGRRAAAGSRGQAKPLLAPNRPAKRGRAASRRRRSRSRSGR